MEIILQNKISAIEKELSSVRHLSPILVETIKTAEGNIVEKRRRPFLSDKGSLCYYGKGMRRWGSQFQPSSQTIDIRLKSPVKTEEERWAISWIKVKERLRESGLWEDILRDVNTVLDIGFRKITNAQKLYWEDIPGLSYDERNKKKAMNIADIDKRLADGDGVNTNILWHMNRPAKFKKMYFGKYRNEAAMEEIRRCVDARKKCSVSGKAGYDVRFEYNPEVKKAWYSEEFRGCGNGHYYLALDKTHALFYEDD